MGLLMFPRALATAPSMEGWREEITEEVRDDADAPEDGEEEKELLVAPVTPDRDLEPAENDDRGAEENLVVGIEEEREEKEEVLPRLREAKASLMAGSS